MGRRCIDSRFGIGRWKHLEEVDMECNDMMDMLTVRMAEREGVTEHLKSVDQLGWVRKMNNIRSRAEEVVLHDLIYMD
ncbi:MAG: TnpV protein [Christensenellales bacterium]